MTVFNDSLRSQTVASGASPNEINVNKLFFLWVSLIYTESSLHLTMDANSGWVYKYMSLSNDFIPAWVLSLKQVTYYYADCSLSIAVTGLVLCALFFIVNGASEFSRLKLKESLSEYREYGLFHDRGMSSCFPIAHIRVQSGIETALEHHYSFGFVAQMRIFCFLSVPAVSMIEVWLSAPKFSCPCSIPYRK